MRNVKFGKSGLEISELGFGGIPIIRLNVDKAVKFFAAHMIEESLFMILPMHTGTAKRKLAAPLTACGIKLS